MPTLHITIRPLPLMLDPEARAICDALHRHGHTHIEQIACSRVLSLTCQRKLGDDEVITLCEGFLTNPAIEHYAFSWQP